MFLSLFFLLSLNKIEEINLIFKFTFIILAVAFIFYLAAAIIEMINRNNPFFYGIGRTYVGLESPPRSSGLSRLSLVICVFLTLRYYIKEKNNNYLYLILISLAAFFIFVFQARTISFIFYTFIFISIIFNFKKFFYDKKLIIFLFFIPLILSTFYNYYSVMERETLRYKDVDNELIYIFKDTLVRDQISSYKNKEDETLKKINRFSSSRLNNWIEAKKIIQKNYFKGYGPQADRIFIKQSIHNAILYSALSGSIISALSVVCLYLISIYYFIKIYFFNAYNIINEFEIKLSMNILVVLNLRSILETSFAIFSIDYLIFIACFVYLNHLLKKNYS